MAPVLKRLTISLTGSTSSMGMGPFFGWAKVRRPRRVWGVDSSSTMRVYSWNIW